MELPGAQSATIGQSTQVSDDDNLILCSLLKLQTHQRVSGDEHVPSLTFFVGAGLYRAGRVVPEAGQAQANLRKYGIDCP